MRLSKSKHPSNQKPGLDGYEGRKAHPVLSWSLESEQLALETATDMSHGQDMPRSWESPGLLREIKSFMLLTTIPDASAYVDRASYHATCLKQQGRAMNSVHGRGTIRAAVTDGLRWAIKIGGAPKMDSFPSVCLQANQNMEYPKSKHTHTDESGLAKNGAGHRKHIAFTNCPAGKDRLLCMSFGPGTIWAHVVELARF